jgi:hypothetical protein
MYLAFKPCVAFFLQGVLEAKRRKQHTNYQNELNAICKLTKLKLFVFHYEDPFCQEQHKLKHHLEYHIDQNKSRIVFRVRSFLKEHYDVLQQNKEVYHRNHEEAKIKG